MKRSCGVCVVLVIKFNCDWCVCTRSGCFMAALVFTQQKSTRDCNRMHLWSTVFSKCGALSASFLLCDAHVPVFCRTTSMWTRRRTSWWRTSWLMTKGCRTRRAMATASNWIRRLWLRRASRAAANPQSLHIPRSLVDFDLVVPPKLRSPPPQFSEEEECFLRGVVKAPDSSPSANGHMTCCLWASRL